MTKTKVVHARLIYDYAGNSEQILAKGYWIPKGKLRVRRWVNDINQTAFAKISCSFRIVILKPRKNISVNRPATIVNEAKKLEQGSYPVPVQFGFNPGQYKR